MSVAVEATGNCAVKSGTDGTCKIVTGSTFQQRHAKSQCSNLVRDDGGEISTIIPRLSSASTFKVKHVGTKIGKGSCWQSSKAESLEVCERDFQTQDGKWIYKSKEKYTRVFCVQDCGGSIIHFVSVTACPSSCDTHACGNDNLANAEDMKAMDVIV